MNSPKKVIGFINLAHFIDHYAMLVFAAAVIVMAPVFNMTYAQLLPYATPGFIAFGAGSLISGWLGDRWSRRNMLAIFFIGMGSALLGTALIQTPITPQNSPGLHALNTDNSSPTTQIQDTQHELRS